VVQLLKAGADANARCPQGNTALHVAAQLGNWDVAALLVLAGADLELCNKSDQTPLHIAILSGHVQMVKQLLAAGADPGAVCNGSNCWLMAVIAGPLDTYKVLLAAVTKRFFADKPDAVQGMTPLHAAVEQSAPSNVTKLLGSGADVNQLYGVGAVDRHGASLSGASCLHRAIEAGLWRAILPLATRNNLCCVWRGQTPLQLAVSMQKPQLLHQLLTAGLKAMYLAAASSSAELRALVPDMVRSHCIAVQQQQQQRSRAILVAGVARAVHALQVAAAAEAEVGPVLYEGGVLAVLSCFQAVREVLGDAAATSLLQQLLDMCTPATADAGGILLQMVRLLPEVWMYECQPVWELTSRLHKLVTHPLQQAQARTVAAASGGRCWDSSSSRAGRQCQECFV
jgi:hypothetical protein